MKFIEWLLITFYIGCGTVLFLYGLNCYWQVFFFVRGQRFLKKQSEKADRLAEEMWAHPDSLPIVTTQIPLYNEFNVAARIMEAVAGIDYPKDRHQIQVLDDSNDETCSLIDQISATLKEKGHWVEVFRRDNREGFKAGALKAALEEAQGDYVAIFDGDFVPTPQFMRQTLPLLIHEKDLALVQGRWTHLNPKENLLCRAQSVGIDGHFSIEQAARASNDLFLNFNGTAGLWRKKAIYDCGNWEGDTLTEDMDLSYRAQLAGWRLTFRSEAVVPAELPSTFIAFKNQQFRWAKGSIQTARKLYPRVWKSGRSFVARLQALFHLTHYGIHPVIILIALMSLPMMFIVPDQIGILVRIFGVASIFVAAVGPNSLYVVSQRHLYPKDWPKRILFLPILTVIGLGISVSNCRGVIEGLAGIQSEFVRTPKKGSNNKIRYQAKASWVIWAEIFLAIYCGISLLLHIILGVWGIAPFLLLYTLGYSFVGFRSLIEIRQSNPLRAQPDSNGLAQPNSQSAGATG
ncbi:glycosyltransferase [Puniceicoccus vermicola]|uniref:Glycosyltransferase n=1 Tax=Puniceicoccus vermicola TaxID=388746 RepID=A0A7X1E5X8_9BACT|nr:glycosyltransferase [Puniceicoccus vermicola]MBC2603604.1 glycosyltransferase [Puniceicoccus vermicola]